MQKIQVWIANNMIGTTEKHTEQLDVDYAITIRRGD
uniref:Uncharacterized protein n=1 Tax=Arundo donax TaxID=35708 RepID=A0A0A9GBD3_ARUDO